MGGVLDYQQRVRIIAAAEFSGRSLRVHVVKFHRGELALLQLRVRPKDKDDFRVFRWRYGSHWAYPPVPPVWPLEDVDPWEQASWSGPLPLADPSALQRPCRSCGTVSAGPENYCGHCGSPLDEVEALATSLSARPGGQAAGSPEAGEQIAALVERCTENAARYSQGREELLAFIKADFTESASARFVRGEPVTTTPGLTLAMAQDIHQAVVNTGRVRPDQVQHAKLLLRYAPLQFGYWGPFKALVKSVPIDDMADAYADAVARISSKDWAPAAPEEVLVEDVSFLSEIFPAASTETVRYLARRARRDLADLADRSSEIYAAVATRMILSWDRELSRNAFAPAYVMLGARKYLDKHSENVVIDPDMDSRRDAHPEIWDDRPDLVRSVFNGISNSVEAHTWSYQVLESLGQAPLITGVEVKLALRSAYPPLVLAACQALSIRPNLWDSLTVTEWVAFFCGGDDASIDGILDAMSVGTFRPAAAQAADIFLACGVVGSPARLLRISLMYLTVTQPIANVRTIVDPEADAAAITAIVGQSATKYEELWKPVIKTLGLEHLQRVRRALPDGTSKAALKVIDDLILTKRAVKADPSQAMEWIASANPVESQLGWDLLDRGYGLGGLLARLSRWISRRLPSPSTVERILSEILARASLEDAPRLAEGFNEAIRRGADSANLSELLRKNPLGNAVLWNTFAAPGGSEFAPLLSARPEALRLAGNSIEPGQLVSANAGQLQLVLQYIKENPARIASDADFGFAAATSTESALQAEATRQLQDGGHMPARWLQLAKSGLPNALVAARDYVAALGDGPDFRDAVLECMDSQVLEVILLGFELLRERLQQSQDRSLWNAVVECDDPRIEDVVAEYPRISEYVDGPVLADFDRRILLTARRFSRPAKESVKARLDASKAEASTASPERIATLLSLTRGETLKDKEWALQKLAELVLSGVDIDGLEVSLITTGDES